MNRRKILAASATVAIAGCSSDETADSSTEDGHEALATGDTESETNSTSGNETETPADRQPDQEPKTKSEPTDEEHTQEHIDAAVAAFEEALGEFWAQSRVDDILTPPLDASHEIETGPITDALDRARSATQEVAAAETTADQAAVIAALETNDAIVRSVLDAQTTLNEAYNTTWRLLSALETVDEAAVTDAASDIDNTTRGLRTAIDTLGSTAWSPINPAIDARMRQLVAESDVFGADLEAMESLAANGKTICVAHTTYLAGRDEYDDDSTAADGSRELGEAYDLFKDAEHKLTGTSSRALGDVVDALDCHVDAMASAATLLRRADGIEYQIKAENAADEARACLDGILDIERP